MNAAKGALAAVAVAAGVTAGVTAGAAGLTGPAFAQTTASTSANTNAGPGTSSRAGGHTLSAVQAKAAHAVSQRVASLNRAISDINANKNLTSADRSAVLQILNGDLSAMNTLGAKIAADTTVSQAVADYRSIFTGYRVYALALPQARLVAAADDLSVGVVPRLTDAQSRLQALLSGKDASKDTPAVQASMADLAKQISGITTAISAGSGQNGLATSILAYTPAQWNANHSLLDPAHTQIQTARADAKAARADVKSVIQAIK